MIDNLDEIFEGMPPKKLPDAKLKAMFIKSANDDGSHNRDDSKWRIFQGDKIIGELTVKELTSQSELDYKSIATAEFGKLLLEEMRKITIIKRS